MPTQALSLKVPKTHGETALVLANKLGLTNKTLQIQKDDMGFLFIPLVSEPNAQELEALKTQVPELQLTTQTFTEKTQQEKTLTETLQNQLPPHLLERLPRALDVVGDIAIIEIPAELEPYKSVVGEAVLRIHRGLRVVLAKAGKVSGVYRLRDFEFIAGEHRTETVYKEYGCTYAVDVARAYFSPRLSHEHERVASLVGDGEVVVDLFAGVGPFAIPIAKSKRAKVYAIDINPEAVELLKKNVRLNRVSGVYPIVGDAREVVQERLRGVADRVIMNLPETANEFVDVACAAVKPTGGVVHFYGFIRLPTTIEDMKAGFCLAVEKAGRRVERFLSAKTVRETAPYEWQAVLDAQIR